MRQASSSITVCAAIVLVLAGISISYAGNATWDINPPTNDWNTATNWTPDIVPNGPNDTAIFNGSNGHDVLINSDVELNALVFTDDLNNSETITVGDASTSNPVSFTLSGTGISTDSYNQEYIIELVPTLATNGARNSIFLKNSAAIGFATFLRAEGGTGPGSVGGQVQFHDNSTAGSGAVSALGGESGGSGGEIWFLDNSSGINGGSYFHGQIGAGAGSTPGQVFFKGTSNAGDATVSAAGALAAGLEGGIVHFLESSNAGNFSVVAFSGGGAVPDAAGGNIIFSDTANAGSAKLSVYGSSISQGGTIRFLDDSSGGTAKVELKHADNATFDISGHNPPGVSIGSLDGERGTVSLGTNNLTVGTNNLTRTYSGLIKGRGSLTKIGSGTLTLKGKNTYGGGTTIDGGTLNVTNQRGSVTGTGPVTVFSGVLAGNGIITGQVTITGGGSLGRSGNEVNSLTIEGPLNFLTASRYSWGLNLAKATADQVTANGVTIASGTHFKAIASGDGTLAVGTTFVIISNTSANPISGTFAEIPDSGSITVGSNTFQANYEGGDGNDLTLTVVP